MLFQGDSDQVTACESPRVEYFLSVHSSPSAWGLQIGYPYIIWNGTFCLFVVNCLPKMVPLPGAPPALKLSWKDLGFLTNTFCYRCYLNAYKGLHKDIRSLQPLTLTRPHTGKNWSTQPHTHGFFWPGLHQPVPDPVLPQPDSSQVALCHHALWVQGYVSITGCTSNPTLLLTAAPKHLLPFFRFFYSYSQI